MPAAKVGYVIVDDSDLMRAVSRVARINNLAPAFRVIGEILVGAVHEEFETAGHGKWPPLAASTIAKRRHSQAKVRRVKGVKQAPRSTGDQPLRDTGGLEGSMMAYSGDNYAEAATSKKYARFHVSDEPRSKIPLRNFLDVPDRVFDEAEAVLMRGILGEPLGG